MKHIITKGDLYTNERGLFSFVLQYLSNCRHFHTLNEEFLINFDLRNQSLYYDNNITKTNNVWEYYIKPEFDLNQQYENILVVEWQGIFNYYGYDFDFNNVNERHHANNIIKQNLKFTDNILLKVDDFYDKIKDNKILGVHIRGTDITIHHTKHDIEVYINHIDEQLKNGFDLIFVCTDEYHMLNLLKEVYGDKLIHYNSNTLSNNSSLPLFKQETNHQYQMGEDVIVESLILSKTNFLIKSNSNVSNFSLLYNPDLNFIQI
jgi:hypothetical protein